MTENALSAPQDRLSVFERMALARKHEQESGEAPILDPDFADDVAEMINNRNRVCRRGNKMNSNLHQTANCQNTICLTQGVHLNSCQSNLF